MTIDEAKRCLPGRRVHEWALADEGTVIELRVRQGSPDYEVQVWLTVRLDSGGIISYQDDECEYLDAL